ncbi:GTP-binding protein [Geotalea uraniireducens]|uniref:sulfate adenylyltransferase n=1 Tax=Geotalea uraniireducens (strain Rf4) TaxID=351605 RepID=A5G860_GEOUR|nr:GTP-binding protein [Geotalea uraniireducens]ABQ27978.1 adenylylsulfate kinase [Geotalea uraniireducens Rf4]
MKNSVSPSTNDHPPTTIDHPPSTIHHPPSTAFTVVIVGHVDHGKSTLLGRIYADTDSLPDGQLEKVRAICEQQGKAFEYAFLFDAFLEEQEQGITIDTARTFFSWENRQYIIIDAPGHKEFLKNMISGAARAEAAVLIIDAAEGVREQSRRHGYMLSLLGIRQIAVVVNKMDLVGYDEQVFNAIVEEYGAFLKGVGVSPQQFIPASARNGDNVVRRSDAMPWYRGSTVLESLGLFEKLPTGEDLPLRFPVQDVYKFDARRIIAGRLAAGVLRVGDTVVFSPSNKTAVVKTIEAFNVPHLPLAAVAGKSTGFTLDEQIFVERGEIASLKESAPEVSDRFRANLFWMGKNPLVRGRRYGLRLATCAVEMELETIHRIIDAASLDPVAVKDRVDLNDVAEVTIRTRKPIALDCYAECDVTGRFVVVDGYDVWGGGIVTEVLSDEQEAFRREARQRDIAWRRGEVQLGERVQRNGHNPGIILFTGESGTGKARLARHLERRLFNSGRQVYLLDGKNLLFGLGLDVTEEDKDEMVRRFGEVAQILLRAGQIVVSTTNTFARADHQIIRTLVHPHQVISVHMAFAEGEAPENTDLNFLESDDLKEAARRIVAKMEEMGVLL